MKLSSFKFQDGKVFWLPEYPEKRPHLEGYIIDPYLDPVMHQVREEKIEQYNQLVAQSLASAIEVAPEDVQKVKRIIWWQHESLDPLTEDWPYDKGKVYSAECEMEIDNGIAYLKPKDKNCPCSVSPNCDCSTAGLQTIEKETK